MTELEQIETEINNLTVERFNLQNRLDAITLELRRLRARKQAREKTHKQHFMFGRMSQKKRDAITEPYWAIRAAYETQIGRKLEGEEAREHFRDYLQTIGVQLGR